MSEWLAGGAVDRLFSSLDRRAGVLVAVSGGPDSMALLRLVALWAGAPGRPPVFAATVDHGLRSESREEAEQAAKWVAAAGVSHAILTWMGPKPTTRLQETARDARYALLESHARERGADTLLTAHHANDQAETILFRLTRGSGVAGLAGMARESRRGGLLHVRPLLDLPKSDLIEVCVALGQPYVVDPSNENPRFARTGLRRLTALLEEAGLGGLELLRLGRRAARAEAALSAAAEQMALGLSARREDGLFAADLSALRGAPLEWMVRLLAREIEAVTGRTPRLDRLESLAGRVAAALDFGQAFGATLGGAFIRLDARGVATIGREGPRLYTQGQGN